MHNPILAIETTGPHCSVTLHDGKQAYSRISERKRSHADELLAMIDELLKSASMTIQQCCTIAVNVGPGSFTGIRIGIAVAQGLAFGAGISTCAISGFQAMVTEASQQITRASTQPTDENNVPDNDRVWATLIHAREDEFYFASYQIDDQGFPVLIDKECVLTTTEINDWLALRIASDQTLGLTCLVGEAWRHISLPEHVNKNIVITDVTANAVAEVARFLFDRQLTLNPEALVPSYLKDEMHYRTVNDDCSPS